MERSPQLAAGPTRQASGQLRSRSTRQNRIHAARRYSNKIHRADNRPQGAIESSSPLRVRSLLTGISFLVSKRRSMRAASSIAPELLPIRYFRGGSPPHSRCFRIAVRAQQVDATLACSLLAGVWNSKVFRGRWLRRSAILSSSDCVKRDRSIFLALAEYRIVRKWILLYPVFTSR